MESLGTKKPSIAGLRSFRRKVIDVSGGDLIRTESLPPDQPLPVVVRPNVEKLNLELWSENNRSKVEELLSQNRGLLFRGFVVPDVDSFERFVGTVAGELLTYVYRSTPRREVSGRVYSSTEYPPDQSIPLHNEMAYSRAWPMKIAFHCVKNAEDGGETPIADSRRVFDGIDPEVRDEMTRKKVMYVRNYGEGLDLPWQDVFQTNDRKNVEAFCRRSGIEIEWRDGDGLRTRQVCQAVAVHPATKETVWFNQAHLFHISSLEPPLREMLLSELGGENLPRNAYYGDGTELDPAALESIRAAFEREEVSFPWHEGDVLLLDNMLVAHGRRPFSGQRKIVVGMAEELTSDA